MYRLHREALALSEAYPEVFEKTTRHKDGTATMMLTEHYDPALLSSITRYLDRVGVHVVHFQMGHVPNTVKLSTRYTIVVNSFHRLMERRCLFIPGQLQFNDPISTVEAARLIGMSVEHMRILAKKQTFDSAKIGGVYYISHESVIKYRKRQIADALHLEFGLAMLSSIERYLMLPPDQLPMRTRVRSSILSHFDEWYEKNF